MKASMDKYDLINGIERETDNNHVLNNNTGERLLEMSHRKYELLTGASVIPKTSDKEEEYKGFK
ncbi:MAG: hypothetical protein J6S85_01335 [Methanobrevibacter sp.]|nr:hypothetical protein [Methanobrevibacter sp.]